ncbi:MAG: hypothetical protein ACP5ID_02560 [Conexivisphaera sp.]
MEIPGDVLDVRRRLDPALPLVPSVHRAAEDMLPFRARDAATLPWGDALRELASRAASGSLSLLEFAYSSVALASGFSLDPRTVIAGIEVRDGVLTVRVPPHPPVIGRRALARLVGAFNALADATGAAAPAAPEAAEELAAALLVSCGSLDRAALRALLRRMRFRLDLSERGAATLLCGALRRRGARPVRLSFPGRAFSVVGVDLGFEGAVMFSGDLPKAMNYLLGSGDVVELVAGGRTFRRRALLLRDLPGPEASGDGFRSLGALALDAADPALREASERLSLVRVSPGAYEVNPSTGAHLLFPAVEDEYVDLNVRACPVCGAITHSARCPSCGAATRPTRFCPNCRVATDSEVCERCGSPTVRARRFRVSFSREVSRFRGAGGLTGERDFPGGAHEDVMKGVLRARYGLRVHCDGTTRAAAVLLGSRGLPPCSVVLPFKSARTLFEVSRFVDDVASKAFSLAPPYDLSSYRDLRDREVVALPRRSTVGRVVRIAGFVDSPVGFSGPGAPRGLVSLILPLDLAWNASMELASARSDSCEWGVPTAIIECGGDRAGGEHPGLPEGLVFVESGMTPGSDPRSTLERALERNLELLSSLGVSAEVCGDLRRALEDLMRLYASPEAVCESCGRRFRRHTISGTCPHCGGRLRPSIEPPDLESLRALAESAEEVCGPLASMTVDRLVSRERQSRLTDFA